MLPATSIMPFLLVAGLSVSVFAQTPAESWQRPFGIRVVDAKTGRGVPMVRLRTVNHITHYTDSAGWVAFREPGLMNQEVFFHVDSHGYEYPKDGFGYRGVRLRVLPGAMASVKLQRKNLAERLYRITGQGIYSDSLQLGKEVPLQQPLLNGQVLGQDSVQAVIYRGRIHWFWGDTNRPAYPLGQFRTSGATSALPEDGNPDPAAGIDLDYFVDEDGFSRPMVSIEGPGAVWLHGLFVLRDDSGEKLIAHYARVASLTKRYEHGLVIYDDEKQIFQRLVRWDDSVVLYPRGQAFAFQDNGEAWIGFATPFPGVRVRARLDDVLDPARYQAFTCLEPGTRFDDAEPAVQRDDDGRAVWDWKTDTDPLDARRLQTLVKRRLLEPHEARLVLQDPQANNPVYLHSGSVNWNPYRNRWILLGLQVGGQSSFLGEVWFAEADRPEGPWINPRHVVTHDQYSFYNPVHHVFLDQQAGRYVYFEGTFASTFSAAKTPVPRYDYNQIMYRLDLADPQLNLPGRQ
jgi:hypothetical protein